MARINVKIVGKQVGELNTRHNAESEGEAIVAALRKAFPSVMKAGANFLINTKKTRGNVTVGMLVDRMDDGGQTFLLQPVSEMLTITAE